MTGKKKGKSVKGSEDKNSDFEKGSFNSSAFGDLK